ncbi:CatB-related O-acetyltransferase [Pseudomonas sp.]|uniref:CatB-related O-acetyltransferase n=1 Tax=Pseudomonas TaxID=286 RepID=UPI00390CCAB3
MIKEFRNAYWKRWLRKQGCKLSNGPLGLSSRTTLLLEEHVSIGPVDVAARHLSVGAYTYIRGGSELYLVQSIGRFCSIGNNVLIGQERDTHPVHWATSHPFASDEAGLPYQGKQKMSVIGHDVWIGRDAMIMDGLSVGTGAVIAARALVTKDVPPYAIVGGSPARIIRYRFAPELIERLLASQWWTLSPEALRQLPFDDPERFVQHVSGSVPPAAYKTVEITRKGCRVC